ncbi:MAG: TRAP transporter substrate-binding protein DctP [Planctomycetes bacterium]|nr:TRAP transporter substrate-binding protein DctP [Planctomycetota bacterium]
MRRTAAPSLVTLLAGLAFVAVTAAQAPERLVFKIATVAPEGTTAVTAMQALGREVDEATGGQVQLKLYSGAVLGDEPAMLEKMEGGQLHGAGFTGVGLGRVLPELRVLEIPFFYADVEEQDRVVEGLTPYFEGRLAEKGYVLLGWADVGWVHLFSKRPLRSIEELRAARVWAWEGDPLAAATFRHFGVKPVPLALTDVLPMLDTGLVDTVYNTPYYTLGLQWHPKLKVMMDLPLNNAIGAVLLRKDRFEAMGEAHRARVLELGRARLRALVLETRREQVEAREALQDEGIQIVALPETEVARFREGGAAVAEEMAGDIYPRELLERVRALRTEHRAGR